MIIVVDPRHGALYGLATLASSATFERLPIGPGVDGGLVQPGALAWLADGRLVVADSGNNRLVVLNLDAPASLALDASTSAVGPLARPTALAVGPSQQIAVADTDRRRIVLVTIDDPPQWSHYGSAETQALAGVTTPTAVHFDSAGRLLVTDPGSGRLLRADSPEAPAWSHVALPDGAKTPRPYALASGPDGGVLIADLVNSRILLLAADDTVSLLIDGRADRSLVAPAAMCLAGSDLYIADAATTCISRWALDAVTGTWGLVQRRDGRAAPGTTRSLSSLGGLALKGLP